MPGNWKKLMLAVILVSTILSSGLAHAQGETADSSKSSAARETDVLKLSLADALKMAEENNPQVALSKLAVEKANLGLTELNYKDKKYKDSPISSDFDYKYNMEIGKKSAELGLRMAQAGVDATLRNIRFGVEAAYYGALAARDNLKIAQDSLKRQQELLKIAEAKLKTGMIAEKDLMDAQVQVAKAQTAVATADAERQKAYINLKKLLNIDLEREIELTDTFDYKPLNEARNFDEILKDALEKRMDIIESQGNVELAQLDFDLTSKVYPSNTFKYKEKEYALNEAKMNLDNTKKDVEAEVKGILLDLAEAESNIPVLDKSLNLAKESLRLANLSFEAGLVRRVDVSQAEEMLKQVELQRSQAIYNYNLAKVKLENVIYIPVSNVNSSMQKMPASTNTDQSQLPSTGGATADTGNPAI